MQLQRRKDLSEVTSQMFARTPSPGTRLHFGCGHMTKAEKPKAKPKPKYTDKAQSERFIEAARKLGIEETGEAFERAFTQIAPPKASRSTKTDLERE
jgi:hypothetical protein